MQVKAGAISAIVPQSEQSSVAKPSVPVMVVFAPTLNPMPAAVRPSGVMTVIGPSPAKALKETCMRDTMAMSIRRSMMAGRNTVMAAGPPRNNWNASTVATVRRANPEARPTVSNSTASTMRAKAVSEITIISRLREALARTPGKDPVVADAGKDLTAVL